MPTFYKFHVAAIAFGAALAVAGCGGGDTSSAPTVAGPPSVASTAAVFAEASTAPNTAGVAATWSVGGRLDFDSPFFRASANGRSCASCHSASDGWSLTPASLTTRFAISGGSDPVFLPHDGANSPASDVATPAARRSAYSMLLSRAVIRIGQPMPAGEFELVAADDPYGYASAAELSLFRRPLPTTNLRFIANVMWDGRETPIDPQSPSCITLTAVCFTTTRTSLLTQAMSAARTHQQMAAGLTQADLDSIVRFQLGLITAQKSGIATGGLDGAGARGGPGPLAQSEFWFGINDFDSGDYRTGAPFSTHVVGAFDSWNTSGSLADADTPEADAPAQTAARQAVARGQGIFNGRPMFINGVPGMRAASVRGSCTSCHNTPDVGSSSTPLLVNIGTAEGTRRTPDLPLYTLRNRQSGQLVQVSDPGAAMQSGRWADIGKFKVPGLRGLAARPPYFHNGSAASLAEVVQFYNDRFQMSLTPQESSDLVAFLSSL